MLKQLVAMIKRTANWPWAGIGLTAIYFGGLVLLSSYHPPQMPPTHTVAVTRQPHQPTALAAISVKPRSTTPTPSQQNNKPENGPKLLTWLVTYHDEVIAIGTLVLALFAFMQWRDSRRSSQRQLRAYVDVDRVTYVKNPHIDDAPWDIDVTLKNFGQTPARNVVVKMEIAVGPARDESKVFEFSASAKAKTPTRIPPGHPLILTWPGRIAPGVAGFMEASQADCRAYVWGQVSYCDVFDKEWTLCFQMVCSFKSVVSFCYCPAGNSEEQIRDVDVS